jgi:hypothetical protein
VSTAASLANALIGIDIGRVLMCPAADEGRPDTSFLDSKDDVALQIPPAPHALDVIAELVRRCDGRVWLVSKAGDRIEALTRRWLQTQDFFVKSGMDPEHVRFCRKRPDKRSHAIDLGLTHFIDDRSDVLVHLRGVVPALYLFGVQADPAPPWANPVRDWFEVERKILG